MRPFVVLDFETASSCDLKRAGAWRYAEDPTTEVICLAWALTVAGETHAGVWDAQTSWSSCARTVRGWVDEGVLFVAHNAAFEKAIWRAIMQRDFGWPAVPNECWADTLAMASYAALPAALDRLASVLRLPVQKDTEGRRITLALSRPSRKTGAYDRTSPTLERVKAYCLDDVRAEYAAYGRLASLWPHAENEVYLLDQKINERGIRLDRPYIRACQDVVAAASSPLLAEFKDLTGYDVGQNARVLGWANSRGAELLDLRKETLDACLGVEGELSAADYEDAERAHGLEPDVRRALKIRRVLGSSSVKKLPAMLACVCEDGRARGTMQYHGAHSGRWAGRLFQPQNFPRGVIDGGRPEDVVRAIMARDTAFMEAVWGSPIGVVVSGLRHAIVADPGRILQAGDFSGIEARIVLALAGQRDKLALMASGADVYIDMAQTIYKRPLTKKANPRERQVGKATVLGCGFQMGATTFRLHAATVGVDLGANEAEAIVQTYRKEWAPAVPKLWYALDDAAIEAVKGRGVTESHGCTFAVRDGFLCVRIPSGRTLRYYAPRLERKAMPWDPDDVRLAWSFEGNKSGHWLRMTAFGGLLTENVVQALARDLMVAAMVRCEAENIPVVLTVHDELVTEPIAARAHAKTFEELMSVRPRWASEMGVPVATEAWVSERYQK